MKLSDRFIAVLVVMAGIAIIIGTFSFREIPGQQFGSAFFPRIIGVCLGLVGIAQLVFATPSKWITIPNWMRQYEGIKVLATISVAIGWIYAVPYFGFILTTTIMISFLAIMAGGSAVKSLITAVGISFLLYIIFNALLRVPLPSGYVESWLT